MFQIGGYTGACDATCGACEWVRETTAQHTYYDAFDTNCDFCGATRKVCAHVFSGDADAACNICGVTTYPGGNILHYKNDAWRHVNGGRWVKDSTLVYFNGAWRHVNGGICIR